jgi:hypothetical protein
MEALVAQTSDPKVGVRMVRHVAAKISISSTAAPLRIHSLKEQYAGYVKEIFYQS